MQIKEKLDLKELGIINELVSDYLQENAKLKNLYSHSPKIEQIQTAIDAKSSFKYREELHRVFEKQFQNLDLSETQKENLQLLKSESTFTICTAHQLCLFTGPSYFVYKILSAVKLAKVLADKHPDKNFIPVYWMGSEDHDFEEIASANIYGKKIEWQRDASGAVGRLSQEGLEEAVNELAEILGERDEALAFVENIRKYFLNNKSYGQAFQAWVMDMFKGFGLLVLDQDDADLKSIFLPAIQKEIREEAVSSSKERAEKELEKNYHVQAHARAINLFYLDENLRERIIRNKTGFEVNNSKLSWSEDDLISLTEKHPEKFSPNVFLRPVYQESVLPNVAFIGGPGEVSYWLQLKDVFDEFNVPQPLILLRDMAVVLAENDIEKIEGWDITVSDLFTHYDEIAKQFVERISDKDLDLNEERSEIEKVFDKIKKQAVQIDPNMERSVDAEQQKVFNSLANLESKLIRAEKRNYEQQLKQLERVQSKLLPNNTLQERYDNFIPVYLKNQETYFEDLLKAFNAFDNSLKVYTN